MGKDKDFLEEYPPMVSSAIFPVSPENVVCENAGSCEMVESTEDIRSDYSYGILSDYTDLH